MTNALALVAALAFGQGPEKILAPADAWIAAEKDLIATPESIRPFIRYLTTFNLSVKERAETAKVLGGHVNQLSTEPDLIPLVVVPGSDGSLLRLNIEDYGWSKSLWEKLADADPWFHVKIIATEIVVPWPGGVWPDDGKFYPAGAFNHRKQKRGTAIAPDIGNPATIAAVVAMTGSSVPIVRGDWFVSQTAIQEGKTIGYLGFLGIKNQKDFERLVRFDATLAKKLEQRRIVVFSGITLQPRRIERTATVLGGLWRTFDAAEATDNKNPLRVLDDDFRFDATEQIAPLLNGMPAYYLGNSKGESQTHAPDNVVGGDRLGGSNDTRLHSAISCIRCHFGPKENGVKDLDSIRIGKLKSVDYRKFQELRRQYLRDVAPLVANDRNLYAAAIKQASGMEASEWAQGMQRMFSRYEDARIDAQRAAVELGVGKAAMLKAFTAYDAVAVDGLDSVLSVIMNGGAIPQRQWEEAYPLARQVMASIK